MLGIVFDPSSRVSVHKTLFPDIKKTETVPPWSDCSADSRKPHLVMCFTLHGVDLQGHLMVQPFYLHFEEQKGKRLKKLNGFPAYSLPRGPT